MKLKEFLIVILLLMIIGCVHLEGHPKIIKISDIKGAWESTGFGYHYLKIDENRKGYFISTLNGEFYENYEIKMIGFGDGYFTLNLISLDTKKDNIVLKGSLFGADIITLKELEGTEDGDYLSFIRISKSELLRNKANEIIIEYNKTRT